MAIVSFEHKLVFVKTQKTAGTSIEVDLSQNVEPGAIVTPILPAVAGHVARNYCDATGTPIFFNHMSAAQLRDRLGEPQFSGMLRFCVEREPVEKCISHFHMLRNSAYHRADFADTWDRYCEMGSFPVDLDRYSTEQGYRRVLLVDHVLRYDALTMQLGQIMNHVGLPHFRLTARAKSEYSQKCVISPEHVTPAQRAKIYGAFAQSLDVTEIDWSAAPLPLVL